MYNISVPADVAAALHRVFASSPHAADSLELWLAVTAEAARHLTAPPESDSSAQWLPVFLAYRRMRTDAEYHTGTAAVRITTGPLAGITYTDPDSAARAVATVAPLPAPDSAGDEDGEGVEMLNLVPTWRLPITADPAAQTQPAVSPLIS
ncbi:hypothetical protein [Nocardia brevicatena]|uniref:hypothetical protein n=1 Tax=Nocardia brevicatena TaxID=37327 RepID=UPI00031920DC|nr:hypothetical protein [Nocardia brevicatena]